MITDNLNTNKDVALDIGNCRVVVWHSLLLLVLHSIEQTAA